MQPEVPGLRIMEEGILVPQWQRLLLLQPPGDLGTCCYLHQITVTRVFCLTSNLQSPLELFLGCPEGVLTTHLPSDHDPRVPVHCCSSALYPALPLLFSQLCTAPICGETPPYCVQAQRNPFQVAYVHPSPLQFNSSNEAYSELCQGLPPLTHPVSLKVICKLLSTLTSYLMIPNPLSQSLCSYRNSYIFLYFFLFLCEMGSSVPLKSLPVPFIHDELFLFF